MKLTTNLTFDNAIKQYEEKYDYSYYYAQLIELEIGFEKGLDISVYAHPDFAHTQMKVIREGLEKGLDVSLYAHQKFDQYANDEYLDLDALIRAYALLCKQTNLMPIDEWGLRYISDHAPYRVYYKGES